MRRDQPLGGGERHQLAAEFFGGAVMGLAIIAFEGDDFLADELAGAGLQFGEFGGEGKIH